MNASVTCFSAQPRADGDEARHDYSDAGTVCLCFSAQPRADGDEADLYIRCGGLFSCFSAQPRADGDEAVLYHQSDSLHAYVSVLNREPMGMKPYDYLVQFLQSTKFQCSTASRWG